MDTSAPTAPVTLSDLPKTVVLPETGWKVVILAVAGDHPELSCVCAIIPTADAWDRSRPYPHPTDDIAIEVAAFDAAGNELDRGSPSERSSAHHPVILASYFFESPRPREENPITLRFRTRRRGAVASGPPSDPAELREQLSQVVDLLDGELDLVARRSEAIEIVHAAKDGKAAVARLVSELAVGEQAAHGFVYGRISSFTARSRKDRERSRQWALRDIERLTARLDAAAGGATGSGSGRGGG